MTNVLREKRIAAGYKSVRSFTQAIGISNGTYWNWENGYGATTYSPKSALIAKKVCEALNISDATLKEAISNNYRARSAGTMEKAPKTEGYAFKHKETSVTVLANWRLKEQLTSNDVAELLGVSQRAYLDWENGVRKPTSNNLKNLMDLTGLSMHQIASIYTGEKIVEIEDPHGNVYEDVLKPDPDEPAIIASPITPEEFTALNDDTSIYNTAEDPEAGKYIFEDSDGHAKLTREGERKVAEHVAKIRRQLTASSMAKDFVRQKALNEPHDFRDEVIDEVLDKMYGQMDYKKYVFLVGLLGR